MNPPVPIIPNLLSDFYSVRAVITFLNTSRLLLISILSFAYCPVVPVNPYFSEPAKSTSCNLETVIESAACFRSYDSTVRVNIV